MDSFTRKRNGKVYHRTGTHWATKAAAERQQKADKKRGHASFITKEKDYYMLWINLDKSTKR